MEIVEITKDFVKTALKNAEGGHDWFHTLRVYNNALHIAKYESVNQLIVELAALLHDIADSKFHKGDETKGPGIAREFLSHQGIDNAVIDEVVNIIKFMSFKNTFDNDTEYSSKELQVVQDADRLDAIGAIGIARCFNYGGFKNRALFHPDIPPNLNMSKTEYKAATGPTINHFYEKLLLLKDQMNTSTGKTMALKRHNFMLTFLEEFYAEWHGKV
ncbi:HD domain-containing protein [Winogradskyella sp. DF17]|uniref:HD domain-containing protein n=1 Tax=Winogradskyella pelagia TaxID=2819984 RepID=A0ABS3SXC8_9FLAO|nr:HD domain-containing protein [Winogradskyella sp. DF17]MBO3115143.1 HD domain-containing protein [Winogradskyella sp. DF17]